MEQKITTSFRKNVFIGFVATVGICIVLFVLIEVINSFGLSLPIWPIWYLSSLLSFGLLFLSLFAALFYLYVLLQRK